MRQRVAQRLAHLLARRGSTQALCIQYRAKPSPAARDCALLVLVVREDQVEPAAVDVELRRPGSGRPSPSTPGASRAGPDPTASASDGSPGLAAFHSAKSRGSRLPRVGPASPCCISSSRWPDSSPYAGEGAHVEVDVAARGVGVPAVDQALHQLDHLRHVPGGPRLDRRRQAAERVVGGVEGPLVRGGPLPPRLAVRRPALVRILSSMSVTLRTKRDVQPAAAAASGAARR